MMVNLICKNYSYQMGNAGKDQIGITDIAFEICDNSIKAVVFFFILDLVQIRFTALFLRSLRHLSRLWS